MTTARSSKNQGPREILVLVVARANAASVEIAGVDMATRAWVRAADATGERAHAPERLARADGTHLQSLDTVRVAGVIPAPRLPFVETALVDCDPGPARTGHIEERALSRTLADLAAPHLDTLLPTGKRVLTTKDFQPGGRQRSIAMIRPDHLQHVHFSYEGEDIRVGVSFRHRGQAYGGPTGLPCPDLKLRAYARDALRKAGTLTITLDGRACSSRFASPRIYLTIGLAAGDEGTFWPQVLGFHPIREYRATIHYDRL
ncbi:MAG: dual OB domain-containing protein [Thermomicrobiales bacterium]